MASYCGILSYLRIFITIVSFTDIVRSLDLSHTSELFYSDGSDFMPTDNSTNSTSDLYPYPGSTGPSIYVITLLAVLVCLALVMLAFSLCHKGEAFRRS